MNEKILFELALFDPDNTLMALLEKHNIEFRKVTKTQKFVVAMDETVKVFNKEHNEILVENLVLIFKEWLEGKRYRKLQALLVDGSTVYIDKGNNDNVANILNNSLKITAFDPEYNIHIQNK